MAIAIPSSNLLLPPTELCLGERHGAALLPAVEDHCDFCKLLYIGSQKPGYNIKLIIGKQGSLLRGGLGYKAG